MLTPPQGKAIVCNVRGHIPYIDMSSNTSVPAASGPWVAMPQDSDTYLGKSVRSPVSVHGAGGPPGEEHTFLDADVVLTCLPVSDHEQLNICRSCEA